MIIIIIIIIISSSSSSSCCCYCKQTVYIHVSSLLVLRMCLVL